MVKLSRFNNILIGIFAIIVLIVCSILGAFLNKKTEKYKNINWTDTDISLNTDISNITLLPMTSGDYYIPSNEQLEKTTWDKNKINTNVEYHDDPKTFMDNYSIPFGAIIVYDNSGKQILLKSDSTMAKPVFYDPITEIYNPTTFTPDYKDMMLLR